MTDRSDGCRVVLGGWYGAANLGDEMILATFAAWIREAGGVPIAISVTPAYTRHALAIEAVGYNDLPAIVEAVASADLLLLGGGGLFQDYDAFDAPSLERFPAANVSQFAQFFYLAEELDLATAVLAQGVGPLRGADGRAIAADVFTRAGSVSVRDEESAALVRELGVARPMPVAPDPAWTLPVVGIAPGSRFESIADRPVMALVVRDWPFDRAWEDAFVAVMASAFPREWGLVWVDFSRAPDAALERPLYHEIAPRLAARLPQLRHAIYEGLRLEEAMGLIAGSDALIAMRLHGVLAGHLAGKPVIAIEYDGKVKALGDALGMPGTQRMPLDAIGERLPGALEAVCGHDRNRAFRVDGATAKRLGDEALSHRALLWKAMARARGPRAAVTSDAARLKRWTSQQDDAGRMRIAAALDSRRGF